MLTYGGTTYAQIWRIKLYSSVGSDPYNSSFPQRYRRLIEAQNRGASWSLLILRLIIFQIKLTFYFNHDLEQTLVLALGFINVIISEGLYDEEFIKKWTVGFDKLEEHISNYPPSLVESITSVPEEWLNRQLGCMLRSTKFMVSSGHGLARSVLKWCSD